MHSDRHRSCTGRHWILADSPAKASPGLDSALPWVARACLERRRRGVSADRWLFPSPADLHDPYAMMGMERAVGRIRLALQRGEAVRIVTDYDVDGTTSSLIIQSCLRALGNAQNLTYHIPDRFDEGYGFSVAAARRAIADGVGLIITADIGVRDHEAVRTAAAAGVDVIVCDHHLPAGDAVPADAFAVLCPPQAGCAYPNPALAACGVSLKLAQALLAGHPKREALQRSLLKMAAIGTVADVVDLGTPENRAIVALGLQALRQDRHSPGLVALLEVAGLTEGPISSSDLGFRIGPRINAAGRLDNAMEVIKLFDERDPARARERAKALDQLNQQRQGIQRQLVKQALAGLPAEPPAFVVAAGPESEGWHRGVVGVVAARIRDAVHRPAAVLSIQGAVAVGSVRSVPGVHAVRALDAVADLLQRYGGHPVAAGFSIRTDDIPALQTRLAAFVDANAGSEALVPTLELDVVCPVGDLNEALAVQLERLGPFGKGNPEPLLLVPGVRPERLRPLGQAGKHLLFQVGPVEAVWWSGDRFARDLQEPVDLAVRLGFNHWRGRRSLRLTVEDARPAQPS